MTLRDAVPANTTYVAGSTTLNGIAVPDGPSSSSPLAAGILIHAPEDPTPGAMRADASATTSNVATIVFDVVVNAGVVNGTMLSNQGFVSAVAGRRRRSALGRSGHGGSGRSHARHRGRHAAAVRAEAA